MGASALTKSHFRAPTTVVGLLTVGSFAAGLLVEIATVLVERAGIEGADWSLRGNGALIVPACAIPVALIAGWALLTRSLRPDVRAGLGGVLSVAAMLVALVVAYRTWIGIALLTALALIVLGLWWARRSEQNRARGWFVAGAILLPAALLAGFVVGAAVFYPGS